MGITLTINHEGQVALGKDILEHLGVAPGKQISVEMLPGGRIEMRAAPTGDISAVFGVLNKKDGPQLSIEQINEIARRTNKEE